MMEKPVIRISVRNLVEFILRNGDLESGGTAGDKEAMLKGSRLKNPEADGKPLSGRSFTEKRYRI